MALAAEQPAIFSFFSSCQVGNHFPKSGVKIHHWKPPSKFWFSWEVKTHCFQRYGGIKHSKLRVANIWHSRTSHDCWQTLEKNTNAIQGWGNYPKSTSVDFVGTFLEVLSTAVEPTTFRGWVFRFMACSIFSAAARGTARIVMGLWPGVYAPWDAGYWTCPTSTLIALSCFLAFICVDLVPFRWRHFSDPKFFLGINFLPSLITSPAPKTAPAVLTPWKMNGWNLKFITRFSKKMIFQTSMELCSMFIFSVPTFCRPVFFFFVRRWCTWSLPLGPSAKAWRWSQVATKKLPCKVSVPQNSWTFFFFAKLPWLVNKK